MNSLTVNLHLLMLSFYRPQGKRNKIIIEYPAFPSDQYAVDSQVEMHRLLAADCIIELKPETGTDIISTIQIEKAIAEAGDELALVMIGGVNYFTGQFFDLAKITKAAHAVGAIAGFDLAHAAGNVALQLHDWEVDFAVWCSYKYLNSGPGGTSGAFVHEKHGNNTELFRLAGWWGNDEKERFQMNRQFKAQKGAAGWQMSNAQVLSMAAHHASLDIIAAAGFENLCKKSKKLTAFLEFLLIALNKKQSEPVFKIITPSNPTERGCQISILSLKHGKQLHDDLTERGVVSDWRQPDGSDGHEGVIRVAPVPLYNTFEDVYQFVHILEELIRA
ncbi:UNVERIFIED_CONTAM: hypothetical protein GTU68_060827 [Idotea baltica]|nr:hypothetical protein [Idotea baltica]